MLEALLFASGEPLEKKRIATLLAIPVTEIDETAEMLRSELVGRGIILIETEQELELRSAPEAAEIVKKLTENELSRDLGKAGLETLAIILYRGGASRVEIDWIRGVNSSATLRSLMVRGLIEGTGDAATHRRIRYHATPDALAHLGVSRANELPRYSEFAAMLSDTDQQNADVDTKKSASSS